MVRLELTHEEAVILTMALKDRKKKCDEFYVDAVSKEWMSLAKLWEAETDTIFDLLDRIMDPDNEVIELTDRGMEITLEVKIESLEH